MSKPQEPKPPDSEPTLSQQQDVELANKFLADYNVLVKKYGMMLSPNIVVTKIQPNVNPDLNLNPLGANSNSAK